MILLAALLAFAPGAGASPTNDAAADPCAVPASGNGSTAMPLGLIVFMAWTVFWIDPKHLAPQIGVSTATVFTLIAFQLGLGRFLPRVSYLTRADKFLLGATGLVFLALGEAIMTSKLADSDREKLSRRIDLWSRWTYPALFALLLIFTLWI